VKFINKFFSFIALMVLTFHVSAAVHDARILINPGLTSGYVRDLPSSDVNIVAMEISFGQPVAGGNVWLTNTTPMSVLISYTDGLLTPTYAATVVVQTFSVFGTTDMPPGQTNYWFNLDVGQVLDAPTLTVDPDTIGWNFSNSSAHIYWADGFVSSRSFGTYSAAGTQGLLMDFYDSTPVMPVPEPTMAVMMAIGLGSLALRKRIG